MIQKSKKKEWLIFVKLLGMETESEDKQFSGMLTPQSKKVFDALTDGENYRKRRDFIAGVDVEKELKRVIGVTSKKLLYRSISRWAAVIVLPLLFVGTFFYEWNGDLLPSDVVNELHVEAGTAGAVLVLSDGSSRELISVSKRIEEQDGSEIKADSAQLNYLGRGGGGHQEALIYNKLLVGRGHEYMLVLSDGSKIWMNSQSELNYPVTFGNDVRRVKLSGEAYFEIAKDVERPFIVEVSGGFEVKVLGTHFNIKAYEADEKYEATLVEGKIEVTPSRGKSVILEPSEQMILEVNGAQEVRKVNPAYYIAWHEGWFYFNNENLGQVLEIIGRWYDVWFDFDASLEEISITGKVKRFENLNVILDMLKRTAGVDYEIKDKTVRVFK